MSQSTHVKDTGIYKLETISPRPARPGESPEDVAADFAGWLVADFKGQPSFEQELEQIGQGARSVLETAGLVADGMHMPPDSADPLCHDAVAVLGELAGLESDLARGDVRSAAARAYLVGRLWERMGVRPFESVALLGRKVAAGASKGGKARAAKATPEEVVAMVNEIKAMEPRRKRKDIYQEVGGEHGVKLRTIQRRLKSAQSGVSAPH